MASDAPLPPFTSLPRGVSFRVFLLEKMPEELALTHTGETGYSLFAAMAVSSRLAIREIRICVDLVRSLVGEVDLHWSLEKDKKEA
jgi:hypothetical protein